MFKNIIKFEVNVSGKVYQLLLDNDAKINDIKIAIYEISKLLGKIEEEMKVVQTQQAAAVTENIAEPVAEPVEPSKPAE